jgi:uncharacterized membrane protein
MLKRDNVLLGTILGLALPGIAFLIIEVLKKNIRIMQKEDILYVGCVALNLILVKYFFRKEMENTARGVIGATFLCAIVFFYYKMRQ